MNRYILLLLSCSGSNLAMFFLQPLSRTPFYLVSSCGCHLLAFGLHNQIILIDFCLSMTIDKVASSCQAKSLHHFSVALSSLLENIRRDPLLLCLGLTYTLCFQRGFGLVCVAFDIVIPFKMIML